MSVVIHIEKLSKIYDLGMVGTGTLSKDLNRTWAKLRGRPDPYSTIAEINDRTTKSSSNTVFALKDINLTVVKGEVLGIIGKNGAGKSTLLKVLSQITSPTTGTIKMKGRVASLLEVGTGMHPEMTARQNIYLNGSLMGMRRHEINSKIEEIVDFAGIAKYIDTPIKRFSSGMQVRLGFAVAAFLDPEILIVDEVLAVGDAEFQKKAIGKMRDVSQGEGRTVLFVSHNLNSVKTLCNKSIVLDKGSIVYEGSSENGVQFYLNNNSNKSFETLSFEKIVRDGMSLEIESIKLLDYLGNLNATFKNTTKNKIEFNFVLESIRPIGVILQFKDEEDNYLFVSSYQINTKKENSRVLLNCELPSHFFNQGNFRINLLISQSNKIIYSIENILTFQIEMEYEMNQTWFEKTKGPLKPKLKWFES